MCQIEIAASGLRTSCLAPLHSTRLYFLRGLRNSFLVHRSLRVCNSLPSRKRAGRGTGVPKLRRRGSCTAQLLRISVLLSTVQNRNLRRRQKDRGSYGRIKVCIRLYERGPGEGCPSAAKLTRTRTTPWYVLLGLPPLYPGTPSQLTQLLHTTPTMPCLWSRTAWTCSFLLIPEVHRQPACSLSTKLDL